MDPQRKQQRLAQLCRDDEGLATVEYVVLLVLIVSMSVAAWAGFGSSVLRKLTSATGTFASQVSLGVPAGAGAMPGAAPGGAGAAPGVAGAIPASATAPPAGSPAAGAPVGGAGPLGQAVAE